jgi:hypothetical protein
MLGFLIGKFNKYYWSAINLKNDIDRIENDDLFRETIKYAERIYYHFMEMALNLLSNSTVNHLYL